MPEFEIQHYVQNKLLKNFAVKSDNGKYKIQIIDLKDKKVVEKNTDRAFWVKNLYDVENNEDVKKLEKDLNEKIEKPFNEILDRLTTEIKDTFTITRRELEIIKKYLLIQQYRSLKNSLSYNENCKKDEVLSRYNIRENETQLDFWKREMQTILDNSLEDLITKLDLVGVKQKTSSIFSDFLMFVHTCDEFVINDLGYVTERVPVKIDISPEEYGKITEEIGKQLYGADGFGKNAEQRALNQTEYMDNFMFFPVSSDLAIMSVDKFWKLLSFVKKADITKLEIPNTVLLSKHFSLPKNKYVNQKLMKKPKDFQKYQSQNDKFIYQIHELDEDDTIYINNLLINEAHQFIGYKTKDKVMPSIYVYVMKQMYNVENVKNDLTFVLEDFDSKNV